MKKGYYLLSTALLVVAGFCYLCFSNHPVRKAETGMSKEITHELKSMSRGDFALYNAQYEFEKTRNPRTNAVPDNIKADELAYASSLPKKDPSGRSQVWELRGPFNVGGRMLCVAFDVQDSDIMLAGSASGGMWRTTTGGEVWYKVTPPNVEQSATALAQDKRPGKTGTWYYGTGEILSTTERNVSTNVRTIGIGNGIFKSTDNGETWQALPATQGGTQGTLEKVFQGVWRIVTDPTIADKDVVYAACYGAIMRSDDGGATWNITLGDLTNKSFATDIAITSDGVLYAALSSYTTSIMRPQKAGIWRSVDGLHWTNITPPDFPDLYRRLQIAIAPSNENVVYLMTEKPSEIHVPYSGIFNSDNYFYKYTYMPQADSGIWENRTANMFGNGHGDFLSYPNSFISYGGYTFTLGVKPDDENVVFIGGMSLFRTTTAFLDTLHTARIGGDPYDMDSIHLLHPDIHAFAFYPSNPDKLYVACDGGIVYTDDCLAGDVFWNRLNDYLCTSQFYSVAIDHAGNGDNIILGGLQDNNWYYTLTDAPGDYWFQSVDLYYDGFSARIADDRDYAIISAYSGNIWTHQFDENGHTKNIFYQTPDTLLIFYDPTIGSNPIFPFYCDFILDPANNQTFFIPTINSLWRKDNMQAAAYDTSLRNAGWSRLNQVNLSESVEITALGISLNPPHRLYIGTNNGHVYRIDNASTGDPVPVEVTGADFPYDAYVACLDVDQDDAEKLFTVFSNYGIQSIYYTADGGTTWSHVSGNLEQYPDGTGAGPSVRWVKTLHYDNHTVYFAGTSVGLYSTTTLNGNATVWSQEGPESIGNIMVDMIDARESDGFVAVATQGNGLYSTYYDPSAATGEINGTNSITLSCYPNPIRDMTTIEVSLDHPGLVEISLLNSKGQMVRNLFRKNRSQGTFDLTLDASGLTPGMYLVKATVNGIIKMVKVVVMD